MSEATETVFSKEQYDAAYPPGIELHWWMLARTRIVDHLLRAGGDPPRALLEIGCGVGAAVAGLRALGYDCRGVELGNVEPIPAARGYVVSPCDALNLGAPERAAVQCVLLLDVIEHLDDPSAFLASLQGAFPRLRQVVVSVPARQELWSNYDTYYGHRTRYELEQLRVLGAAFGWRLARIGHAFRLPYLPALFMARFGIARSVRLRAPVGTGIALHRLVASLSVLEWRLLPARLPGSSIVARFDVPWRDVPGVARGGTATSDHAVLDGLESGHRS